MKVTQRAKRRAFKPRNLVFIRIRAASRAMHEAIGRALLGMIESGKACSDAFKRVADEMRRTMLHLVLRPVIAEIQKMEISP